jgi:RNA polymerase sigma-70 factor (sigma-E family)
VKWPDEAVYREYVSTRMDRLRRTAYLYCRDWHTADDLVAITIGKLYRNWARATQVANLDAYVQRILVRSWLDEKRRPWRREQATAELPEPPVVATEPSVVGRAALLELLQELPPRRRAVVVLRLYCDLSVEETAEILGCTAGTVKSQTARGLDTLRAAVAEAPSLKEK